MENAPIQAVPSNQQVVIGHGFHTRKTFAYRQRTERIKDREVCRTNGADFRRVRRPGIAVPSWILKERLIVSLFDYGFKSREIGAREGHLLPDRMPPSPPDTYRIGWHRQRQLAQGARRVHQCPSFVVGPMSLRRTRGGS